MTSTVARNTTSRDTRRIEVRTKLDGLVVERARREAIIRHRESLYEFVRDMWSVLEPETPLVDGWAMHAICVHLEAVANGEINRLLINVPPGFSKSLLCNVFFPAWLWGPANRPHLRMLKFSYAASLTERDNAKLRDLMQSQEYKRLYGDVFELRKVGETKITNSKTGSALATSVGGVGTGERGDLVVCFPADQMVATEIGQVPIGELVRRRLKVRAWSYNAATHQMELQPIVGWHKNPGRPLVKVTTDDGRTVTCTTDHRILTANGYRPAASLVAGDCLFAAPRGVRIATPNIAVPQGKVEVLPRLSLPNGVNSFLADVVLGSQNSSRIIVPGGNLANHGFSQLARTVSERFALLSILLPQIQVGPHAVKPDAGDGGRADPVLCGKHFNGVIRSGRDLSNHFLGQMARPIAERAMPFSVRNVLSPSAVFKVVQSGIGAVAVLMADLMTRRARTYKRSHHQLMGKKIKRLAVFAHRQSGIAFVQIGSHNFRGLSQNVGLSTLSDPDCLTAKSLNSAEVRDFVKPLKSNDWAPDFVRVVSVEHLPEVPSATYCITVSGNHNLLCGSDASITCSNCDDPHSVKESESDAVRGETVRWFREALSNRLNDMERSAIVVIMQRVHEADVSGTILSEGLGYTHLMIPMEYDPGRHCSTSIGWTDPRTEDREPAWPERFPPQVIADLQSALGPYAYAGQYQQSPAPRGGGIFQRDWWQLWADDAYPPLEFVLVSADTAYTEKESNDPSACTVWGLWRENGAPRIVLIYAWRKFLQMHGKYEPRRAGETTPEFEARTKPSWGLVEWLAWTCRRYKADKLIIEGKASGLTAVQEIQRLHGTEQWNVQVVQPHGDKVSRAHAVQPVFSQLLVYAPDRDWADMVMDEMQSFPRGRYKDLTDSATQAMKFMRDAGLIVHRHETEFAEQEARQIRRRAGPLYPA